MERGGLRGQAGFEPLSSWLYGCCCGGGLCMGVSQPPWGNLAICWVFNPLIFTWSLKTGPGWWKNRFWGQKELAEWAGLFRAFVAHLPWSPFSLHLSSNHQQSPKMPFPCPVARPGIVPDLIDLCWKLQELLFPLIFPKLNTVKGWDDGKWSRILRESHCSGWLALPLIAVGPWPRVSHFFNV